MSQVPLVKPDFRETVYLQKSPECALHISPTNTIIFKTRKLSISFQEWRLADGIIWYCIILQGIASYCIKLPDDAWYCTESLIYERCVSLFSSMVGEEIV